MKKSLLTRTFLVLSGLVAAGIGGALLFVPVEFHASSGIILENDVNLLSEMRAPGGFMFAVGILIMLGAWINNMAAASLVMSCLLFLSYGFSRLLGGADAAPDFLSGQRRPAHNFRNPFACRIWRGVRRDNLCNQ